MRKRPIDPVTGAKQTISLKRKEYARERIRKQRAKDGNRSINFSAGIVVAADILYLQKQWGFKTYRVAVEVALRHLAIQTRQGLRRIRTDYVTEAEVENLMKLMEKYPQDD